MTDRDSEILEHAAQGAEPGFDVRISRPGQKTLFLGRLSGYFDIPGQGPWLGPWYCHDSSEVCGLVLSTSMDMALARYRARFAWSRSSRPRAERSR